MRKLLICIFIPYLLFAQCNWSEIKETPEGYLYNEKCHIQVGETVQENENLKKKLELKDLVIKYEDERAELWKNRTFELEKKKDYPAYVLYGLGVITSFVSMWAVGQVMK